MVYYLVYYGILTKVKIPSQITIVLFLYGMWYTMVYHDCGIPWYITNLMVYHGIPRKFSFLFSFQFRLPQYTTVSRVKYTVVQVPWYWYHGKFTAPNNHGIFFVFTMVLFYLGQVSRVLQKINTFYAKFEFVGIRGSC